MDHDGLILVTGSHTLIGERLIERLQADHRVVSGETVEETLDELQEHEGTRIASVVHLAGSDTARLIEGLADFEVQQLVLASSILNMRPARDDEVITEESALLRDEEELALAERRGAIPAAILRFGSIYDEDGHSALVARQIQRIYERRLESHLFPGNKEHRQPFVHVEDAVRAILRAIERRSALADWDVFLIAEPEPLSYGMLQDRIGHLLDGRGWTTVRIPSFAARLAARMPSDVHYPVLVDKAHLKLDWSPEKRLWDTLPAMIRSLSQNPSEWYRINELGGAPSDPRQR